jgi:hypothetical protein
VELGGGVCPSREGQQTGGNEKVEDNPNCETMKAPTRRSLHGTSFIPEQKKTDSAGLPNDFVTRVLMVLD